MILVQLMNLALAETCLAHWVTIKHTGLRPVHGLGTIGSTYILTYVRTYMTTASVSSLQRLS